MEEFTLRLLDVITNNRLYFYLSCFPCRELDVFLETATATEQKKVHYKAQWNINGCNIVGQQLLTLVDVTCCVRLHTLLHVVAQSFKTVKSFSQYLPPLLFLDHRCVGQQFWIRLHSSSNIFWGHGLDPSHAALQVQTLLRVVASVCTPLPTRTQQLPALLAYQCWESLRSFVHCLPL